MKVFPPGTPWLAFLGGAGTSLLLLPPTIVLSRAWGFLDYPGGRKTHARPTPLAGGIPFLAGAWGVSLALAPRLPMQLPAAAGLVFLGGLWDDGRRRGLPWGVKLLGQALGAALAGWGLFPHDLSFAAFFFFWALLLQNALNFQDNMNGLAAGTGILLCGSATLLSRGPGWVPLLGAAATGALLPLLPANFPKARLFLGDQASQLLGLTLAVLTAAPPSSRQGPDPALLLVPALPLLDMGATLLYRARRSLPLPVGDQNHLSHRLARAGLGPTWAVLLLWTAAAFLGTLLPFLVRFLGK